MGLCHSFNAIDRELAQERAENAKRKVVKLLLLGTGECGKSTVLKQMRIIHDSDFKSDTAVATQKNTVCSNTTSSMAMVLKALPILGLQLPATMQENAQLVKETMDRQKDFEPFSEELSLALTQLARQQAVLDAVQRAVEYNLPEYAKYVLAHVDRITHVEYAPTEKDILMSRAQTQGIVEVSFRVQDMTFKVFDVGGQRSQRRKWLPHFEGVTALIFIVAVSEYDEELVEDETTNRLLEAMRLYESICNSIWFKSTSIILFLNKKDLFARKIVRSPLKRLFKEYEGPAASYEASMTFLKGKFADLNKSEKTIYMHETCATDTTQVQVILESCIDMIIHENMKNVGLL